jgi:predicted site-specific integrase-resolvase
MTHAGQHVEPAEFLSIGKAASLVGRSPRTLRAWVAAGKIDVFVDFMGRRYFAREQLDPFVPRLVPRAARGRRPT